MQRLLIVGCGDVVRRALPQLLRQWRVYALVRHRDADLSRLGVTQIIGDLDYPASLERIQGLADAVIHSAPPPPSGHGDPRTARLLARLGSSISLPRSMVYISTTGVYGDAGGAWIDETRPLAPTSDRARRRVDAERRLRNFGRRSGCRVTILRAPGIYAADRLPLARLEQGLPLLAPEEDIHTNHIHAEDLARACIAALRRGRSNRAYNAVDNTDLTMGEWFDLLADRFALPRGPRLSRAEVDARVSPMQRSFMGESRRIRNDRLRRELDFRFLYPDVMDGIAAALSSRTPPCSG